VAPPAALADRLQRLRHAVSTHAAAVPPRAAPAQRDDGALCVVLRGEWLETVEGPVFVKESWFPLDHEHGTLPLGRAAATAPGGLRPLLADALDASPERFAYFDIETTGLSGGVGTYAFLLGLGTFEDAGGGLAYRLRQYFLAGPEQERAMLSLFATDIEGRDAIVTYNGRAFDLPIVRGRFTLARLPGDVLDLRHIDLLHAVRRLYRHRMPGCRLAEAERRLLRVERFDDLPGALIPSIYFDYVRAGRVSPLRAVFRHNAEDVLSLAGVLASLAGLFGREDLDPEDAVAVARWWEREDEPERAAILYREALPWLEGGDDWGWAAGRHALLCKRAGDRVEAVALWERLWANGGREAGLELAKHHEHHARDLPAAEEITRALLLRSPEGERIALEHRLARIVRKRARAGTDGS
jgi:uncharacterized protein YprB with RNaseH-like and TPR domain